MPILHTGACIDAAAGHFRVADHEALRLVHATRRRRRSRLRHTHLPVCRTIFAGLRTMVVTARSPPESPSLTFASAIQLSSNLNEAQSPHEQ